MSTSDRINDTFNDLLSSLDGTIASLSGTQGEPDAKTERAYYAAQRRGYAKAQLYHLQGVRPVWTGEAWLITSASRPGVVHRVARIGEILACNCEAAQNERLCWHKLLAEVVELAGERAAQVVAAEPDPLPPAPALRLVPPAHLEDDAAYAAMLAGLPRAA
jgi:hypothetical protein